MISFCVFIICFSNIFVFADSDDLRKTLSKAEKMMKKHYYEDAIEEYKNAIRLTDDVDQVLEFKIMITECYFKDKDYDATYQCCKIILRQYFDFTQKEHIVYLLCLSLFNLIPSNYDVDISQAEDLALYIKYYKNNFPSGEYKDKILEFEKKITEFIILKDFSNIKFYFENKIYSSCIFCCDWFFKKYSNSSHPLAISFLKEACEYKISSQYKMSLSNFKKIKKMKNKDSVKIFAQKIFTELREILIFIENSEKEYYKEQDALNYFYQKCYDLMLQVADYANQD